MGCKVIHLLILLHLVIIVIIFLIVMSIIIIIILISSRVTGLCVPSHSQLSQSLGLFWRLAFSSLSLSDFGRRVWSSCFVGCIVLRLLILVGFGRRLHGM